MPIDNEITVIEARDWIKNGSNIIPLDLREPETAEAEPLEHFRNIAFDELTAELPSLNQRKTFLLLCDDGKLSRKAHKILKVCFLKSFVIRGGINDWHTVINPKIKRNYPLEKPAQD